MFVVLVGRIYTDHFYTCYLLLVASGVICYQAQLQEKNSFVLQQKDCVIFFTLLNLEVVGGCHFWLMDFVNTHFDTKHWTNTRTSIKQQANLKSTHLLYTYIYNIYIIFANGDSVRGVLYIPHMRPACVWLKLPLYSGRYYTDQLLATLIDLGKECTPCPLQLRVVALVNI